MANDINDILEAYHVARTKYDEDISIPQDDAIAEIKRIIEEAKPEMPYEKLKPCPVCGEPQYNHSGDSHFDYGVNWYEENLLKALEEV